MCTRLTVIVCYMQKQVSLFCLPDEPFPESSVRWSCERVRWRIRVTGGAVEGLASFADEEYKAWKGK